MTKMVGKKRRLTMTHRRREALHGLAFIAPWIVGMGLFFAYPLVFSFLQVFQYQDGAGAAQTWSGLRTITEILQSDVDYIQHYLSTMKNMAVRVPMVNVFALFIAMLLNRKFPGRSLYRALFFLPVLIGAGAAMQQITGVGMQEEAMSAARELLLPQQIRNYLGPDGTEFIGWFMSLITTILWMSGVQIVIYLSGLQGISRSLYEAAKVDSATEWESFWLITLPMISPIILLNLIYSVVDCFVNQDDLLFQNIYNIKFKYNLPNADAEAAAKSWLFFLWVFVLVAVIFLIMRPFVNRVKD